MRVLRWRSPNSCTLRGREGGNESLCLTWDSYLLLTQAAGPCGGDAVGCGCTSTTGAMGCGCHAYAEALLHTPCFYGAGLSGMGCHASSSSVPWGTTALLKRQAVGLGCHSSASARGDLTQYVGNRDRGTLLREYIPGCRSCGVAGAVAACGLGLVFARDALHSAMWSLCCETEKCSWLESDDPLGSGLGKSGISGRA